MSQAVIIGAGPAGLTAAYELSKYGIKSVILEADDIVGGISRTADYKGYRFDIGGHRFFTKVPYVRQLWQEILPDDFLIRPRLSRIHYRGYFFDYPLKALNAFAGLGPVESLLIVLSYSKAKIFPNREENNFEQWVSNRFGYRLYNIFFKTYTEKVWGISCKEIAADWAAQRIKNLSLSEALKNAFFGSANSKNGNNFTTLIERFHYPRLGPGMMWETCEEILAQKGIPTLRGTRVERIRHRKGIVECVCGKDTKDQITDFEAGEYISSMPLRELIFSLDPPAPDKVREAAGNLRYRDYLTVVLIVNREKVFPDNWIYIHTPEVKMGRIQNYKNWSPDMVPDQSKTALGLEYFLWLDDDEWTWSNDRLIDLGVRECTKLGIIEPDEVIDGTVVRMEKAYPVYDQNYQDALGIVKNYLQGFENLQTVGRNGLHRYNNQDHSMLTAVYAARNIMGEAKDVWNVNTEREYHEDGEIIKEERLIPVQVQPVEKEPLFEELVQFVFARLDPFALGTALGIVMGLGVFMATAFLLLKGGEVVGPRLALLGQFFIGYKVSWTGAFIGLVQGAIGGLFIGGAIALFRNWIMLAYIYLIKRRAEAEENRDLLDKV